MCTKNSDKHKQELNYLLLLQTSRIIYHKCHVSFIFPIFMFYKYLRIKAKQNVFELEAFPADLLSMLANNSSLFNVNTCAIINSSLHRVVFHSSLLGVLQAADKKHIVQLFPSEKVRNVIAVSPSLLHNFHAKTCTVYAIEEKDVMICSEIHLSLVGSPKISENSLQSILKRFFRTPKLLHSNDLIEIHLRQFASDLCYVDLNLNAIDVIYFKCNRLISQQKACSAGFCLFGTSTLKLTRDAHEKLPCQDGILKKLPTNDVELRTNIINFCPPYLDKYLNELSLAIRPFSQQSKCLRINPLFLLYGPCGSGKSFIVKCLASKTGFTLTKFSMNDLISQTYALTEVKLKSGFSHAISTSPCILQINNFEEMCKSNDGQHDVRITNSFKAELENMFKIATNPIIVICLSDSKTLAPDLERLFLQIMRIELPNQTERELTLQWISNCQGADLQLNDCKTIAAKSHGFAFNDLQTLLAIAFEFSSSSDERKISIQHLERALEVMKLKYLEDLGAPNVPEVKWSDVGGLQDIKSEIMKTINFSLKQPIGWKRSGILLYGPPGTGKTLMAKAVATECNLCFLSVKGPELLNMYIGQSEQNIREVFERARAAAPCIIFFDELDSLVPNRGLSGDSGGVMDRVVSQLLAEMDGLNKKCTILIIGATNRPDLIDPALLRPGRFDKLLYVGPCTSFTAKLDVLQALTRKFRLSGKVNLENIIRACPKNITGADFYGICCKAWMSAATKHIKKQLKDAAMDADEINAKSIIVTQRDFEESIRNVKPSVSPADLQYFERLLSEFHT